MKRDIKIFKSTDSVFAGNVDLDKKIYPKYTKYRTAGFVILTHKNTNKNILFINSHLQTDSNDTNNNIKKLALENIKKKISFLKNIKNIENIVFCGDFNIDLKQKIIGNVIDRATKKEKNIGNQINDLITYDNDSNKIKMVINDNITLYQDCNDKNNATTVNEDRCEHIDYILSDFTTQENETIYDLNDCKTTIPNDRYPSDHIPVTIKFTIHDQAVGAQNKEWGGGLNMEAIMISLKKNI